MSASAESLQSTNLVQPVLKLAEGFPNSTEFVLRSRSFVLVVQQGVVEEIKRGYFRRELVFQL